MPQKEGDVIVCNAISGRDFRLFMHMRTVYKLLVVENKILCSHELFSSCFPNNPDLADPKSQHVYSREIFSNTPTIRGNLDLNRPIFVGLGFGLGTMYCIIQQMAECPVVELPFGQHLSVFSLSVGVLQH